ncbi:MAG: rhodanese-like domain-containing protein [Pseudomonadota bacterium]
MSRKVIVRASLAYVLVAGFSGAVIAQDFSEGSFEEGGGSGDSGSSQGSESSASGFGDGSFDDNGGGGSTEQSTTENGAAGFDDGSFDDASEGGGTVASDSGSETGSEANDFDGGSFDEDDTAGSDTIADTDPVGGDDFPQGGVVLPETVEGGGGATLPEPGGGGSTLPDPGGEGVAGLPPPDGSQSSPFDPQIEAYETRDFGVPPQNTLRQGQFHGPTPVAIPGANLVTTNALVDAFNQNIPVVLIDVLGNDYSLPGTYTAPALASPGSFADHTQQQAAIWLHQISGGRADTPIVVFCSDPMCWLSYNAALRTVAAGYTNVYWYRGGLNAWQMAGLPLRPAGF